MRKTSLKFNIPQLKSISSNLGLMVKRLIVINEGSDATRQASKEVGRRL